MAVHQHLSYAMCVALGLLKHGELVGVHSLIFVSPALDVPSRKIATIAAGEGARSKATHGNALPVAVVDVSGNARNSGIAKGKSQRPLPGSLRYRVTAPCGRGQDQEEPADQRTHRRVFQKTSRRRETIPQPQYPN